MSIKYFKRKLPKPQTANNGSPRWYETSMLHFRVNCDLTIDYLQPWSYKDVIESGWEEIDGWEFGAVNNGVSVEDYKVMYAKAWKERDR